MNISEETKNKLLDELLAERAAGNKLGRPVLVTTEYRGVFFGYATNTSGDTITLKNARNCIYWHKSIGGFAGLATIGPNSQCKIGAQVSQIELRKVTSISEVTDSAAHEWGMATCVS